MNKLKLDPLENEFSRLKNLEDFADDYVWQGINEGLNKEEKKKKRIIIWFFTLGIAVVLGALGWFNYANNNIPQPITSSYSKQPIAADKTIKINIDNNRKPILNIIESNRKNTEKVISKHTQKHTSKDSKPYLFENKTDISQGVLDDEKLIINGIEKLALNEGSLNIEFSALQPLKTTTMVGAPHPCLKGIEILGGRSLMLNPKNSLKTIGNRWNAGFNFTQSLNKRLTVSLGFSLESYQLKGTSFTDQPNRYVSDSVLAINHKREIFYYKFYDTAINTTSTDFKRQVFQIALPVGIRYIVFEKNKFNLELKGEAILGYNLSKREVFSATRGTKLQASKYENFNQFSHKVNFRLGSGVRFNYTVFKQNSVFISPTVSYAWGAMKNTLTQNSISPFVIGVQMGFCKKF